MTNKSNQREMEKCAGKLMEDCVMIADGACVRGANMCAFVCRNVKRELKEGKRQARLGDVPYRIVFAHSEQPYFTRNLEL